MRNHLKQWLILLQWASFLTLTAAAWLTLRHHSPLGILYRLDEKLAEWFNITDPSTVSYLMIALAIFLFLGALCSFRCGDYYKLKYVLPLFTASTIPTITLILYAVESQSAFAAIATFIIPIFIPFLLLRYQVWKNQVDFWSVSACIFIAITIVGYAYQSLTNPVGVPTPEGTPIRMSELSPELNVLIITSTAYVAIFTAIALFITTVRRLAIYMSIILGVMITGATFMSYFSTTEPFYNISQWLAMIMLVVGYWLLPVLILFSLASHSKTRTLKL